ncbi:hypothetical protein EDB19DRAFT_2035719 [Suillus lakei]|nr:hypothetical protein EDB19DRAFT_2035719 [Suillus lakei]
MGTGEGGKTTEKELLFLILAPLDAYDLIRVRKTCKALKEMVDHSEMLQYVIDLGYFQVIPVGASEMAVLPATQRKRLRQYDAAWQRFEYKQKYTLPLIMLGPVFDILGVVHCSAVTRRSECIHFASMPFGAGSNDLHSWSCATTSAEDFAFCPAQGLLVVVTRSPDFRTHAYDIHLKSLTTTSTLMQPNQILKALDKDIIDRVMVQPTGVDVHIMGNYISMLVWNESGLYANVGLEI